ncbi:MAG: site-specific DNA-methyltransferase [Acidimicrobiia bacterium]|nr:site-specific DNA-methyltransferase [Acidimicrobiia bacterium]MYC58048.1 site-specific DNA-methyltransferase [Acidimicrobiia bacterium]MYG93787.1 site-specific DNA-methyltransferase [Acidimicrobiia bacterium]MYI30779.1 site-specific DNA-methyltransferase [Acidimicrobiia bacterium]
MKREIILPEIDTPTGPIAQELFPERIRHTAGVERVGLGGFDIYCGDAVAVLAGLSECSAQLVFTSPPYADRRRNTYGGIHPDEYVKWFMPYVDAIRRVLRDDGTFVLNIKESVVQGERHTYVLELIQAMRAAGWLWTEEFVWHKKNCYPGKWPNRFRDSWERLLQFNKQRHFVMHQDAVMVPVGEWAHKRLAALSDTDRTRDESATGNGFGKRVENWVGRDMVYPTNVVHLATECSNRGHSAAFPAELPDWFIRLFTAPGDLVIDPFVGSGTTVAVARQLGRASIGIDINPDFCEASRERASCVV